MNILTRVPWCHISMALILTSGWLGHRACVFTTLQGATILFPKGVVQVYSYTSYALQVPLFHILANAGVCKCLHCN